MSGKAKKVEAHFVSIFRDRFLAPTSETVRVYGTHYLATLYPRTVQEVQAILRYANKNQISVLKEEIVHKKHPSKDFLLLNFSRMNNIEWDANNGTTSMEVGASMSEWKDCARIYRFFFPWRALPLDSLNIGQCLTNPSFSSMYTSVYGSLCDSIVGFEGLLGNGEVVAVRPQGYTESGAVFKHLFLDQFGSYGMLTRVVLKTFPIPLAQGMFCIEVRDLKIGFRLLEKARELSLEALDCYFLDRKTLDILSHSKGRSLCKEETQYMLFFEITSTSLEELSRLMDRVQIFLANVLDDIVFLEHTQLIEEIEKKIIWKNQINAAATAGSYDFCREFFFLSPSNILVFMEDCEKVKRDFGINFLFSGSLKHGFLVVYILNMEDEGGFIWNTFQHEIRSKLLDVLFAHGGYPMLYSKGEQSGIESFFMGKDVVAIMSQLQNYCDPKQVLMMQQEGEAL